MIAGLEFIRSWRFWIMLIAATSAVTLGSAGVHIALALYLPAMAIEPDPYFSYSGESQSSFWPPDCGSFTCETNRRFTIQRNIENCFHCSLPLRRCSSLSWNG